MKKINKIIIKRIVDYDTDLNYLGEFSNIKKEFPIEHAPLGNNKYSYFNADNVENMQQAKQNYKRVMEYEKNEVCDYGIKAIAEIHTSQKTFPKSWLINKLNSGGLWGISSDSEEFEIVREEENQLLELKELLKVFGFSKNQINKAKVEYENE